MNSTFNLFIFLYIIGGIITLIGTYITFKLDKKIEHTLYNIFSDNDYGTCIIISLIPIANIILSVGYIILLIYYCIHKRLIEFCKRIKI